MALNETVIASQISALNNKINELTERHQKDIVILTDHLQKMTEAITALQKLPAKSYDSEISSLVSEVEYNQQKIIEARKTMVKVLDLLRLIAVEKKIIEPAKPKTTEEKIEEMVEEVSKIEEKEKESLSQDEPENSEVMGFCLNCNKETPTVNYEITEKQWGKFCKGKCAICRNEKNVKLKK